MLGDVLKVADENDLPHIERGLSSVGMTHKRDELERTHAMEVLRTLDGATRARMISKRIPSLGGLNAEPESPAFVVARRPARHMALDPVSRVDQIFAEELERSEQTSARDFSRSQLSIVGETGEHLVGSFETAPRTTGVARGKHFAPQVKEA